jgi:hypothetical protein
MRPSLLAFGCISSCLSLEATENATLPAEGPPPVVGFFTHRRVPEAVVQSMQFGIVGAYTVAEVEAGLRAAAGTPFRIDLDLSPQITVARPPARVASEYTDRDGNRRAKVFPPRGDYNVRAFVEGETLGARLAPYLDLIAQYPGVVRVVYVTEEPYLNGISRDDLQHAAGLVRTALDARGLRDVRLGVIFATAMFDAEFAAHIDRGSGEYARGIDTYHAERAHLLQRPESDPEAAAFRRWNEDIRLGRLATYDRAGNTYTGGGVPDGVDVVGFDFYASTLLQDALYDDALAWFAERNLDPSCERFRGKRIATLRKELSFFRDGAERPTAQEQHSDRILLDAMFECRMNAATALLDRAIGSRDIDRLLIAESSTNAALDFDAAGRRETQQFPDLLDLRVRDEIVRSERFYFSNRQKFAAGIAFFLYDDAYDAALRLPLGGVASLPTAWREIQGFARPSNAAPSAP